MEVIVLAPSENTACQWQYAIENQGAEWRCTPATRVEQVAACMEDWIDAIILLRCPAGRMLLQTLTENSPLAPPYILGVGLNAPDGLLSAPEELPILLQHRRQECCLPMLAVRHLSATMDIAAALLRTMEVPHRLRAWAFLPEMCALTVVHPPLLADLKRGLYPLIGMHHGMTAAGVERSLRLCVESTWMHGSLTALERFFGSSVDPERGKPTNREFLYRVQERLTLTMQRLV